MATPPNPHPPWAWAVLKSYMPKLQGTGKDARRARDSYFAEETMGGFCVDVLEGRQPRPETLKWIADSFIEILDGKDPKSALCLLDQRGAKEGAGFDTALDVARELAKSRSPAIESEAINAVAARRRKSPSTIEKHWAKHRHDAQRWLSEISHADVPEPASVAWADFESAFPARTRVNRLLAKRRAGGAKKGGKEKTVIGGGRKRAR